MARQSLFLLLLSCLHSALTSKVLVIMFDGFRYDYVDRFSPKELPGFTSLQEEGVKAKWLEPVFPSSSPSNWMSFMTGVYAEDHGIVDLEIYDVETDKLFRYDRKESDEDPYWWKDTRPLWANAVRQGKKVALINWLTCLDSEGVSPQYCHRFANQLETPLLCTNWVEQGITKMAEEDTDFVWVHCDYSDDVGHDFGPDSELADAMITALDGLLVAADQKLRDSGIYNETSVIVISDHGMKDTDSYTSVPVDPYVSRENVDKIQGEVAYFSFLAKDGRKDQLWEDLQEVEGVKVWKKEDTPERYHYKTHSFIHDFLMVAETNHSINMGSLSDLLVRWDFGSGLLNRIRLAPSVASKRSTVKRNDVPNVGGGAHGFDDTEGQEPDMRGIFFARGPELKVGYEHSAVEMVDCYKIICHLLNITEESNKGSWDRVRGIFV